jgi:hypothetical protein
MDLFANRLQPNRDDFAKDPFGYSAIAWHKWGMAQTIAGYPSDISKPPTSEDLKSPVLWMTQAHAMAEAARIVLQNKPELGPMPIFVKGVCDCQYCAVGLMLVGYSLEICLKAMLIMKKGTRAYTEDERTYRTHHLEKLADFVPDLSSKDKAILKALTHFVIWAGRYPDPGSGREHNAEEIFTLSEKHQISARDLFDLAARVMKYSQNITERL